MAVKAVRENYTQSCWAVLGESPLEMPDRLLASGPVSERKRGTGGFEKTVLG
jgi:hypothetical protein